MLSHPRRNEPASWMGHPDSCGLVHARGKFFDGQSKNKSRAFASLTPRTLSAGPQAAPLRMTGQRGQGLVSLVEEHGAVEGVALDGLEAGVADDAAEFFFGGAVAGAGGLDDILFKHDGAYVVAAEVEA